MVKIGYIPSLRGNYGLARSTSAIKYINRMGVTKKSN